MDHVTCLNCDAHSPLQKHKHTRGVFWLAAGRFLSIHVSVGRGMAICVYMANVNIDIVKATV